MVVQEVKRAGGVAREGSNQKRIVREAPQAHTHLSCGVLLVISSFGQQLSKFLSTDPIPSEAVDAARREGRGIITKNDAHGQENCGSVYQ